ncbi:MAG: DUF4115 domain-containing protein [Gammaproteobacteria bacterium]|nr:DUF4115 domain-containing protein [Gammaproteobacteria bacterium]
MNTEVGYGKRLRSAREAAGLSVDAVAGKLHLKTGVVLLLEQEELQREMAPAFIRGYIRAYSQLVSVNADELVSLYNRHAVADPKLTQLDKIESFQQDSSAMARWGAITISIILLVLAAIWLHEYLQPQETESKLSNTDNSLNTTDYGMAVDNNQLALESLQAENVGQIIDSQTNEEQEIAEIVEMVAAGSTTSVDAETGNTHVEQVLATTIEAVPTESELQNFEKNEIVSQAPKGSDQLHLAFDGPSWIEAIDANGYRLVYGLFDESDKQLSVRGRAPFKIIIGDTNNVEIKVNDTKHELRTYTRADNTARVLFGDKNLKTE